MSAKQQQVPVGQPPEVETLQRQLPPLVVTGEGAEYQYVRLPPREG